MKNIYLIFFLLISGSIFADDSLLKSKIYTGALLFGLATPSYFLVDDSLAKTVLLIAQNIGILSIGESLEKLYIVPESPLDKALDTLPELSLGNKKLIREAYERQLKIEEEKLTRFSMYFHLSLSALHAVAGLATENRELKTGLFFLSGVHFLTVAFD